MLEVKGKTVYSRTFPVGGGRTMKEYDQQISDLKKENFSLKMRVYYMEETVQKRFGAGQDVFKNVELQVEIDNLRRELTDKQDMLKRAALAMETLTTKYELEEINKNQLVADYENKMAMLSEQLEKANLRLSAPHNDQHIVPVFRPHRCVQTDKRSVKFKSLPSLENMMDLPPTCQSVSIEVRPHMIDSSQQTITSFCQSDKCTQTLPELQECRLLIDSCPSAQRTCEIAEISREKEISEQIQAFPVSSDHGPVFMNDVSFGDSVDGLLGCKHVNIQPTNSLPEDQHFNKHAENLYNFNSSNDMVFFGDFESRRQDMVSSMKYESFCMPSTGITLSRHIPSPHTHITSPHTHITSPHTHITSPSHIVSPHTHITSPSSHITSPLKKIPDTISITSDDGSHLDHHKNITYLPHPNTSNVIQTSLTLDVNNCSDISKMDSIEASHFVPESDTHLQHIPSTVLKIPESVNSRNECFDSPVDIQSKNVAMLEFADAALTKHMQLSKLGIAGRKALASAVPDRQEQLEREVPALLKSTGDGGDCSDIIRRKTVVSKDVHSPKRSTPKCGRFIMDCAEVNREDWQVSAMLERSGEDVAENRERSQSSNPGEDLEHKRASVEELDTFTGLARTMLVESISSQPHVGITPSPQRGMKGQLLKNVMSPKKGQLTAVSGDDTNWQHKLSQSQAKIQELEEKLHSTENTVRLLSRKNKAFLSAMSTHGLSVSLMGRSSSEACLDVLFTSLRKRSSSVGSLSLGNCEPDSKDANITPRKDTNISPRKDMNISPRKDTIISPSKDTNDNSIISYQGDSMEIARSHFCNKFSPIFKDYWHSSTITMTATPSVMSLSSPDMTTKISGSDLSSPAQVSLNNLNPAESLKTPSRINNDESKRNRNSHTTSYQGNIATSLPVIINDILESSSHQDSHKNDASSNSDIDRESGGSPPNQLSSCPVNKFKGRHVRFGPDQADRRFNVNESVVETIASPDVTFSSILKSPMLTQLVANLERNWSSLRDSTLNASNLSVDQLQAHVEHLQALNLTLKEEVAVYEAILGSQAIGQSTTLNKEGDTGCSWRGRDTTLEVDLLKHHLIEIRNLRKWLERLLETHDSDQLSTTQSRTLQEKSHQKMILARLQLQLIEKGEHCKEEFSEQQNLQHENLIVEKLELTISKLQTTIQDRTETITQQERQIIDLKSDLNSWIERDRKVNEELTMMIREKAELVANFTKKEKEFSELEKMFTFEFSKSKSEKTRLGEEVDEKEKEIERLIMEVGNREEYSRHLKQILVKRERLIQEKVDWLQKLANEKVAVDDQLEEKEGVLKRLEAEIGKLRREMEGIRVGGEEMIGFMVDVEEMPGVEEKTVFIGGVEEKVGIRSGGEGNFDFMTGVEEKVVFGTKLEEKMGFRSADEKEVGFSIGDEGKFRSRFEEKVGFRMDKMFQDSELTTGLDENVKYRNEIDLLKKEFIFCLMEKSRLKVEIDSLKDQLTMRENLEAKTQLLKMEHEAEIERISEEKQTLRLQLESETRLNVGLKLRIGGLETKLLGKTILEQQINELKDEIKNLSKLQNEVDQAKSKLKHKIFYETDADKHKKFTDLQSEVRMMSEKVVSAESCLRMAAEERKSLLENLKEGEEQLRKRDKQLYHLLGQYKKLDAAFIKQMYTLKERADLIQSMKKQMHLFEVCLTCSGDGEEKTTMKELLRELLATQRQVEDLLSQLEQTSSELRLPVGGIISRKGIRSDFGVYAVLKEDCHKKLLEEIRECLEVLTRMEAKFGNRLCTDELESENFKSDTVRETSDMCQRLLVGLKESHHLLSTVWVTELPPTNIQRFQHTPASAKQNENLINEKNLPGSDGEAHGPTLNDRQKKPTKTSLAWETSLYKKLNKTVQDLEQAKQNIDASLSNQHPRHSGIKTFCPPSSAEVQADQPEN